ncbi:MAG: F0F1 ATP synthase subunit B [Cellulosilyticum sp.]|nr:F0F1 ATP synthase subunit B [Cellulosilyticum sp.]
MLKLDWNIIWTFVNLIVLYLLMKKFLFGPVTEMMEKRTKSIEDSFAEAESKNKEAEQIKAEYEEALRQSEVKAEELIYEARERANVVYEKTVKEAEEEAAKLIAAANKAIEIEKKKSMQDVESHIIDLTMVAASKVIGKNIDAEANKQIMDDFLAEVGAAK